MNNELLTAPKALEGARVALDALCSRPEQARVILHIPEGDEIAYSDEQLYRWARLDLLLRALAVRCDRSCEHRSRIAILGRGVDCCMACRFRFADAKGRGDGRCDTCNAAVSPLQGIKYQLQGNVVLPDGRTQASVLVQANVCEDCLQLLEAVPASTTAGAWN